MIAINTIQKRCLIASAAMHGFLALVLVFGSAFFVAHQPPRDYSNLRVIPSRFLDGLSGGGGNPKLPDTNEKQKGDPNAQPAQTDTKPKPKPPEPVQKPDVKPPEPKVIKEPIVLKPVVRKTTDKPKTDETEAKPARNAKAEAKARAAGAKIAQQLAKTKEGLQQQRGFLQGTAINVFGPGGEAFADYAHYVKEMYDDAWVVPPDLSVDSGAAVVKITVARDGRIVRAVIIDPSGQRGLDLSVQRALDKVTKLPAFPADVKDEQRTFTIKFDLEAKRSEA